MPVGARIVLGPTGEAGVPVCAVARKTRAGARRIHQTCKGPLSFFLVVGREREVVVLDAGIFAERPLDSVDRGKKCEETDCEPPHSRCPEDSIFRVVLSLI